MREKPKRAYTKKTCELKEFIEEHYTNAHTPMKMINIARATGYEPSYIRHYIIDHALGLEDTRETKALELIKEGYLTLEQIQNVTTLSFSKIEELYLEHKYEKRITRTREERLREAYERKKDLAEKARTNGLS